MDPSSEILGEREKCGWDDAVNSRDVSLTSDVTEVDRAFVGDDLVSGKNAFRRS